MKFVQKLNINRCDFKPMNFDLFATRVMDSVQEKRERAKKDQIRIIKIIKRKEKIPR